MSLLYGGRALFKCRREGGRSGKSGNGFDVAMMGQLYTIILYILKTYFKRQIWILSLKNIILTNMEILKLFPETHLEQRKSQYALAAFGSYTGTKCLLIYYY